MKEREVPVRVREEGAVTIPANIRRDLGIEGGDYVEASFRVLDVDVELGEGRES